MIELNNITKTYQLGGEKIFALDRVNLKVEKGDFIAIMGPSGSGKSTLANVIGGLDIPDEGQVLVENQDIAKISDERLSQYRNKKVGFIFQTFNLQPNATALENVMVPLMLAGIPAQERISKAKECLKTVELTDRANHLPNQLSGGQRQRVAIARALANDPEIIIADEPTGNLDSKKGAEIVSILKSLNQQNNITLIVITHDHEIAKQAKKIITIRDGKIL